MARKEMNELIKIMDTDNRTKKVARLKDWFVAREAQMAQLSLDGTNLIKITFWQICRNFLCYSKHNSRLIILSSNRHFYHQFSFLYSAFMRFFKTSREILGIQQLLYAENPSQL